MKLGTKIGSSFAALLVIAATLGLLAVWNMSRVQEQSQQLAYEFVPEVDVANQLERSSLSTMYAMRGYGLTGEKQFLQNAQETLSQVNKELDNAEQLAADSPHLVKLKGNLDEIRQKVSQYQSLVEDTQELNKKMALDGQHLDEAAATYMDNAAAFLESQEQQYQQEINSGASRGQLDERMMKVGLVNDVIDKGNAARIMTWKAQARRDPATLKQAQKLFPQIEQLLNELEEVTRLKKDMRAIDKVRQTGQAYEQAMACYLALAAKRKPAPTARSNG